MTSKRRMGVLAWLAPLVLSAGACSSSGDGGASGSSGGAGPGFDQAGSGGSGTGAMSGSGGATSGSGGTSTSTGGASGGTGAGNLPPGSACTLGSECTSALCVSGTCTPGAAPGTACQIHSECSSGLCLDGVCTAGATTGQGQQTTIGPHFPGAGATWRPLATGCGPETAEECTGTCETSGGSPDTQVIRPPATLCFQGPEDSTRGDPSVVIEQLIERVNGVEYVHFRVTFDPSYTNNVYGSAAETCCGWDPNRGIGAHTFRDLYVSDHTEILMTNGLGETVMHFKIDLLAQATTGPCGGYDSLGVDGDDGSILIGDRACVLATATSLDRNLGGCGYCTSEACGAEHDCLVNSPTTDNGFTPDPLAPNWDFRQVYEMWVDLGCFGEAGFGQGYMTYVHSSPSTTGGDITPDPVPCPPDWDTPACPVGAPECGSGGSGGAGGSGGGGTGGSSGTCPPNHQLYVASEGAATCTPIPYANYPGMAACPAGYALDIASEGQYCLPTY